MRTRIKGSARWTSNFALTVCPVEGLVKNPSQLSPTRAEASHARTYRAVAIALSAWRAIPDGAASCHTAFVDGYATEGHVPVGAIRRLLADRPDAAGLALPDMPADDP